MELGSCFLDLFVIFNFFCINYFIEFCLYFFYQIKFIDGRDYVIYFGIIGWMLICLLIFNLID